MKKRLQGLIVGVLIGAMVTSGVVFAKQASETINVIYDNIKILIDGKEYQPTDVNGNTVEPFIYNGTTYLPVRAIANAFDKEVDWEAQTSTVTLGSKNYDWLDQMGYIDYETSGIGNTLQSWSKSSNKACDGIIYDRGLLFTLHSTSGDDKAVKINNDGTLESFQNVEYLLNNQYKTFEGKLICSDTHNYCYNTDQIILKYYGDGNLLYTSPPMTKGTQAVSFNVNVDGYKVLKINIEVVSPYEDGLGGPHSKIGIVDARLSKK